MKSTHEYFNYVNEDKTVIHDQLFNVEKHDAVLHVKIFIYQIKFAILHTLIQQLSNKTRHKNHNLTKYLMSDVISAETGYSTTYLKCQVCSDLGSCDRAAFHFKITNRIEVSG